LKQQIDESDVTSINPSTELSAMDSNSSTEGKACSSSHLVVIDVLSLHRDV